MCKSRHFSFVYSKFAYGKRLRSSLSDFKERNGFQRIDIPRYYVPLTRWGLIAFRLGLHRQLIEHAGTRGRKTTRTAGHVVSAQIPTEGRPILEGTQMPGIVGLITKLPRTSAESQLRKMTEALCHEKFYTSGTWIDEARGVYVGWVARQGSFAAHMPLHNERGDGSGLFR